MFRFLRQLLLINPFKGDVKVSRVWITRPSSRGKTLPIPTGSNFHQPLDILATFFAKANPQQGDGQHNRYLEIPGFDPVFVSRDPGVLRAILTATGDKEGQFDRDTMPSTGIARATGPDTLLFANGPQWRRHRKASSKAFGKTALFQEDVFQEFEKTFRENVRARIEALKKHLIETGKDQIEIKLETEIKCIMMEMLLFNFFGAEIEPDEVRNKYIPAIDRVIEYIVRDTVEHRFRFNPFRKRPSEEESESLKSDFELFEKLTDLSIEPRSEGRCAWSRVDSQLKNEELRSNIKVFLAGALEATTSYASWAISHLARHPEYQQRLFQEVESIESFDVDVFKQAPSLKNALRETLRLTPSLYFLPRRAVTDTWVEVDADRKLFLPAGTHILLDVWHSNRVEEFWGMEKSGFYASDFEPDRWKKMDETGKSKEFLHYGFGHGARVCPGKHLGELEAALVVGGVVKLFKLEAVNKENPPKAGVSTKPEDGTLVRLKLRNP